jgi:hypothetical protein
MYVARHGSGDSYRGIGYGAYAGICQFVASVLSVIIAVIAYVVNEPRAGVDHTLSRGLLILFAFAGFFAVSET